MLLVGKLAVIQGFEVLGVSLNSLQHYAKTCKADRMINRFW
jgi:hypothetical protein